ncbi:plac8 onzin related protein 6 [Osmerus mordax]|uniref:plac8 onzin related protein 6 n=1 Tax=Osmerus mordax TaxID=8014 RepID=UPI00350E8FF3
MAMHPVFAVTHQPGTFLAAAGLKTEMWTSGICDCSEDMPTCCLGFWCPCCLACQVSSGLGESHCLPLLDWISGGLYPPLIPPISLALRSTLRERFHIQGSVANDCCMVTCCSSCSWCQMARELKARANTTIQINMNPSQPPYAPHLSS